MFTILSAVMLVHGDANVSQWDKEEKIHYEKLLEQKPNSVLKNSLLEELYLRDMVTLVNDTLKFKLHFDLHSFDCGAPDCYVNEISFEFPLDNQTVVFPYEIPYQNHEFGCVPKELTGFSTFILVEERKEGIRYYSYDENSSLIISKSDLYYFTDVKKDDITLNNYKKKMTTSKEPYSSTVMNWSYEYLLSLQNKSKNKLSYKR